MLQLNVFVIVFILIMFKDSLYLSSQNPAMLSQELEQRTASRDFQQDPSLQQQYMQLIPIARRGEPSESFDNVTCSSDYMPLSPSSRSWEVAGNTITVNKVIGKGAIGQVAKGTAENLPGKKGKTTVAIKMLKSKSLGHMFPVVVSLPIQFAPCSV